MSKVQLQGNASGTGVFTIASPNSNTDRTLTLPDNTGTILTSASTITPSDGSVTQAKLATGVAGTGPLFLAYPGSNTTVTSSTDVVIANNIESYDTAGCFNNTGSTVGGIPPYAFLPNVAGFYLITSTINTELAASPTRYINSIRLNGGLAYRVLDTTVAFAPMVSTGSILFYLNGTTDYVQQIIYLASSTPTYSAGNTTARFSGQLVRAA